MRFQVDSSEVAAASARTRASANTISQEVSAMMGHLNNLQQSWTGPAAAAFANCANQWRAAQAQVETVLGQISTQLNGVSNMYQQAENTAAKMFATG